MKTQFLAIALVLLGGCASRAPKPEARVNDRKVSVLTYNVENLFDTEDDPEKNDETFLPATTKTNPFYQNKCRTQNDSPGQVRECLRTDWSQALLQRKLDRLTDVVAQVDNGRGPDILIVEEVESRQVLEQWRDRHLKNMDYRTLVYLKGPDERGINPAILSRLPLLEPPKLHPVDLSAIEEKTRPTRGILEAHLRLPNGEPLVVFAVHFPSQAAPTGFRKQAVQTLLDIATTLPSEASVMVGGDFNITSREEYKEHYFRDLVEKDFSVSHRVGCPNCTGTVYYPRDKTWSFFDVLLFSKNLDGGTASWQLDRDSIQVVNSSIYQVRMNDTPARFHGGKGPIGVSDHWPVYAELHLKQASTMGVAQ